MEKITVTTNTDNTKPKGKSRRQRKAKKVTQTQVVVARPKPNGVGKAKRKRVVAPTGLGFARVPRSLTGKGGMSEAQAKDYLESCVEKFLLGETSMLTGFVYPRDDPHPVFQRLLPFTKTYGDVYFDANKRLAFNLHPNPFYCLDSIRPPVGGNRAKDLWEDLPIQTHAQNPSLIYFDKDITCEVGSITASNKVVNNLAEGVHYASGTQEFKNGNKVYATGPSEFQVEPSFKVNNVASYAITYTVAFVWIGNVSGGLSATAYCSETFTVQGGDTTTINIATGFQDFQTAMALQSTYGFAITINVAAQSGESLTLTGSNFSISLSQQAGQPRQPVFGSAYTMSNESIFQIIGSPSTALEVELRRANEIAVTGYSLLVTNGTAPLNRAGFIMGAELGANQSTDLSLDPEIRFEQLTTQPASVYRMKDPISAENGCHYSNLMSVRDAEFKPVSVYLDPLIRQKYNRPYACVVIHASGSFENGSIPNLKLRGYLNVEWRSNSMTFTPILPPHNVAFMVEAVNRAIKNLPAGSLWGENPAHFKKIKKLAAAIVGHPTFRTVIRDVAIAGAGALATVFV